MMDHADAIHDFKLRVSVASLVRVILDRPGDGEPLLALERKATVLEEAGRIIAEAFAYLLKKIMRLA
ncbi:MAG TPA: hypothetical protein VMP08_08600 [Anaerolineae bacterium]|nr:hypothetical protein [Anaerolineae bacterium]